MNKIICGDCLEVLPTLPQATVIFSDPPDNLGIAYDGFIDLQESYSAWLACVINMACGSCSVFWLSYYHAWAVDVMSIVRRLDPPVAWKQFIWRFTFGQHNKHDCGNGYRPMLRVLAKDAKLYPDAIRVPSARQTKYNDKRANPKGRVPDDVWEFPRVCGTFNEKRKWHPNQHPEALIERIIKFSAVQGDLVIDLFAGTGTVNRVCKRLGIDCIGIEISRTYCEKIAEETGAELRCAT